MGTMATTTSLATLMVGIEFDTATTSLATKCITDGENEIKKMLARRYDTSAAEFNTVASIPPMLTSLCEQLAEGYMYMRMSRGAKESITRAKELLKWPRENLMGLSEGTLDLVNTAGSIIAERSGRKEVLCNTETYSPTFDEDDGLDWAIDSDKLDDIADERE